MLAEILNKRVLLIAGKGGVGRSTLAASLAIAGARSGRRVLLCEIGDPDGGGSPLAELFGRDGFSEKLSELAVRLRACHLWAPYGHQLFLKDTLPGGALVAAAMRSKALQHFLVAAPSFSEMGWFYHLLTLLRANHDDGKPEHELIVIDMPATGHTLALTGLPQILLRLVDKGPIPAALREGQSYLNDPEQTAAWIVALPEILPVSEALDLVEGLRSTDVPLGGFVLNRLVSDPFSEDDRRKLDELFDGRAVLGAVDFHRMARGKEAEARLRKDGGLPLVIVPELPQEGGALPPAIATRLQVDS
ncbi:MAG: ArsA-related P-loop ATPase [Pseudomonadales bacterium]